MLVSIAIPVYDMKGEGVKYLHHNLSSVFSQKIDFDLEIIISDQSNDNNIEQYIKSFSNNIKYLREPNRGNHSCNTNNSLKHSSGDIIKILYQDDYFFDNNSLKITVDAFKNSEQKWLISACAHSTDGKTVERPFYPYWNELMLFGNNTFSAPSVMSLKKDSAHNLFDEQILFMPDVEYYYRMRKIYGDPLFLRDITVINMLHPNQTQNLLSEKMDTDLKYIKQKYKL